MLRLEGVTVQFGTQFVLHNVDLPLHDRERAAVVGRNGAGKSTLLKVAAGEMPPDTGDVLLSRGQDVGLLHQEQHVREGKTLWQEAFVALEEVQKLEARALGLLERASAMDPEDPAMLAALEEAERLQERFRHADGHRAEAACGRVLTGLGFTEADWQRPAVEFSGGWRLRVGLARLLLARPSFLLLDEPTNHLDIETRTWLLHELKRYPGGVIVISHDRDFLDRLADRTLELSDGGVQEYKGGWTRYRKARELRMQQIVEASRQRDEERERIQFFIRRFRAQANKAKQVQARVKALEKLPPIPIPTSARRATLEFPAAPPAQDPMLTLAGVRKRFGDLVVLDGIDEGVYNGARILLVGPNGAGKSTLLQVMAGRMAPDGGSVKPGGGCRIAWFAQDQAEELPPDKSVLSVVQAADPLLTERQVRSLLGSLLFVGDDVHKHCGVLSGGEKSRVALAKILLARANLLLLDEPTNHLDVETQDALAEALRKYTGAIVFVSHDRAFASQLAQTVWAVGGGGLSVHHGGLEDFLWSKALELGVVSERAPGESAPDTWLLGALPLHEAEAGASGATAGREAEPATLTDEASGKEAWAQRKAAQRDAQRRERELGEVEQAIAQLEEQQSERSALLADPATAEDWEKLSSLTTRWQRGKAELESLYERWEALQE